MEKNGIMDIIKNQYLFNEKNNITEEYFIQPYFKTYLLNKDNFIDNIEKDFNFIVRYNSGLPKGNLYDDNGSFYIIHE